MTLHIEVMGRGIQAPLPDASEMRFRKGETVTLRWSAENTRPVA